MPQGTGGPRRAGLHPGESRQQTKSRLEGTLPLAIANCRPVLIYVWILLTIVAGVLVAYFAVLVAWMLLLRRMAQSGIRSWDELEPEDAEIHPFSWERKRSASVDSKVV
jgi:hypothetical protein